MAGPYEPARSLAETQLRIQFAVLDGLNTQAMGILAVDAALTAIVVAAQSVLERLWWLALIGLAASAASCFVALISSGDRVGPRIATTLDRARSDGVTEDSVNQYVAEEIERSINVNAPHIKRQSIAIATAIGLLAVALLLGFVSGVVVS